jgi:hypothetical protein
MVWIPANANMKEAGLSDSVTDAVQYLSNTVPEPFSHDATLRKRFFPPAAGFVSATNTSGTGDGLRLAAAAGAALNTGATSPAYWVPASLFRRADGSRGVFPHRVTDRAKPGVIAVNAAGRRFVNEALSHHEFVLAMLCDGNGEPDRPFYLICDR